MSGKFWLKVTCPRCAAKPQQECVGLTNCYNGNAHAERLKVFRLRAQRSSVWVKQQPAQVTFSKFSEWAWDRGASTAHREHCQKLGLAMTRDERGVYIVDLARALKWLDSVEVDP